MGKTIYDKIWDQHLVYEKDGQTSILYIDRHLVHEVTSPQAFEGLRLSKRKVRAPEKTFATMDHNVSTRFKDIAKVEATSRLQMETLSKNCREFGITLYDIKAPNQGIVHVIGTE